MNDGQDAVFDRIAELTELYLLDALDADQHAELETLLREDPQALAAMQTCLRQAGTMRVVFAEQRQFAHRIGEVDRDEYLKLLQTLSPAEEPEPVLWVGPRKARKPIWRQWPVVIPSAIAAVLAIAVTLIVSLSGNTNAPDTPGLTTNGAVPAYEPGRIDPGHPVTRPVVATLTATRNAAWAPAGGASAPPANPSVGYKLRPNQRLTLTAGIAEITTNDGAVAILQAPATVELLNNDNALRLHAGKLVGICETDSSKGFLVRTPHLDITDLGTRFGVDASTTDATEVHVFEGEVEARRPNATGDTEPIRLVANQSIRTTADAIASIELDTDHFATRLPSTLSLAGTGAWIRLNTADPNWQITEIDGRPLDAPQAVIAGTYTHELYQRVPNDPAVSQWLGWSPPSGDSQEQTYTFRTQVTLPDGINPDSAEIHLRYAADNELRAIRVNGQTLAVNNPAQLEQVDFYPFAIRDHLVAGPNTIEFVVANLELNDNLAGLVGLNVRWEIKDRTP